MTDERINDLIDAAIARHVAEYHESHIYGGKTGHEIWGDFGADIADTNLNEYVSPKRSRFFWRKLREHVKKRRAKAKA